MKPPGISKNCLKPRDRIQAEARVARIAEDAADAGRLQVLHHHLGNVHGFLFGIIKDAGIIIE